MEGHLTHSSGASRPSAGALPISGQISSRAFADVVGDAVRQAAQAAAPRPVRAFGEMVALLLADGRSAVALQLEECWNDLLSRQPRSLLRG